MHSVRFAVRRNRGFLQHTLKQEFGNAAFILERRPWLSRGKEHGKGMGLYPMDTLPDGTPVDT